MGQRTSLEGSKEAIKVSSLAHDLASGHFLGWYVKYTAWEAADDCIEMAVSVGVAEQLAGWAV